MEVKQYFEQIKPKVFLKTRRISNISNPNINSTNTRSRNANENRSSSTLLPFKDRTHMINKYKSTESSKSKLLSKNTADLSQYPINTINSTIKPNKERSKLSKVTNNKQYPILPEVALINLNREKLYKLLHCQNNSGYNKRKHALDSHRLMLNLRSVFDSNFKLELALLNKNQNQNYNPNNIHQNNNRYKTINVQNEIKEYNQYNPRNQSYPLKQQLHSQIKCHGVNYGIKTQCGTNKQHDKINQDNYLVFTNVLGYESISLFGVFDGHGVNGHLVAKYLVDFFINYFLTKDNFPPNPNPTILLQHLTNYSFWKKLFLKAEKGLGQIGFDTAFSGSTSILIMIIGDVIICINAGDSRAILIDEQLSIIQLSRDHKPELFDERHRINSYGGAVERIQGATAGPYRVWVKGEEYPGIAMSRSIGDKVASSIGVICEPEIIQLSIRRIKPRIVILASDGIWEYISNETAKELLMPYYDLKDPVGASRRLTEYATKQWTENNNSIDDITLIVLFFPH